MPKIVDHDQRREVIARAAAELIAEKGLAAATFREIAAHTGFSKGVIEHYFDDKEHIVSKALDWVDERYLKHEQRLTRGKQGLDAVCARLTCTLPLSPAATLHWKVRLNYWGLATTRPDWQALLEQRSQATYRRFARDLQEAIALGQAAPELDVTQAGQMLVHFATGVSINALLSPRLYNRRYLIQACEQVLLDLEQWHRGTGAFSPKIFVTGSPTHD
ncbi:TetR/AcrR family transcriptional regulator [Denitratisoma sp. DHT3]|uniref:TetR/AcrR family transcriptional regulator n=1 Tax=Denitratisoma sp. DHT3 TaxID=1981880 RepID=UPI00164561BF|nr:TetR/AcrR family transcriptional regulator [Denitratisoma sp. DHT3]